MSAVLTLLLLPALASETPFVSDAPGEVMPDRSWDVEHLHLAVKVDVDAGRLDGTTTHRILPLAAPHAWLRLHQVALDVHEIRVDGLAVEGWRQSPGLLDIPVQPGVPHTVEVDYSAVPRTGLHFRHGKASGHRIREVWSQGEGEDHRHWFPSWDHPTDRFGLSVDVTAPNGLHAIANGTLQTTTPAGPGWTTWSYSMEPRIVNYLVALAIGEYRVVTLETGGTPQEIVVPRQLDDAAARAGFDRTVPMMPWFERTLETPYPFPIYRQVLVQDFLYGGMENSSTTILADSLLVERPWRDPRSAESVAAHELAHQWFGDWVTCYGWRELWLNEGFATYWTNRWMEDAYGPSYAASRRRRSFDAGLDISRPMSARSWSKVDEQPSTAVYTRGSTVLHMLETHLGRVVFDAGVALYLERHGDGLVETGQFRRALEDVSGEHLGWIFDGWVHNKGAPTFAVRHRYRAPDGESPGQLTVDIEQDGTHGVWHASVEVEIGTTNGTLRRRVRVDEGRTRLMVDLDEAPRWVVADPRRAVLAHWTQEQSADAWATAALESPTPDVRLTALHALGEGDPGASGLAALGAVLADDTRDRDVRAHAAKVLGRVKSEAARDVLLRSVAAAEPAVREEVVRALGALETTDPTTAALRKAADDPHAKVAGAALTGLWKHDEETALARARRIVARPTSGAAAEPLYRDALDLVGRHGEPRDARALIAYLASEHPRGLRHAAAWGLARLAGSHPDDANLRGRISRAIEPLLDDVDQRVRGLAISVLAEAGDARAARSLQAFANETTLEEQAEHARDAASSIRSRKEEDAPAAPDDLERLQEKLDALEERLEDVERWR